MVSEVDTQSIDWGHEVNTPDADWLEMFPHWEPIQHILGGTLKMREAKTKYLPMEEEEDDSELYRARLNQAVLYPFYEEGLIGIRSKPFPRPVILKGAALPEQLARIESDVDLSGRTVTDWLMEAFWSALNFGMVHNLTDYSASDRGLTRGKERETEVHPFFNLVYAPALIGKRYNVVNGRKVLTQIRIRETRLEELGQFGTVRVNLVRVIEPGSWQLWREKPGTREWARLEGMDGEGENDFPNGIPLRTFYTNRDRFMFALPPFEGVAWLQISHWQSYAQQRNFLRVIRYALLHGNRLGEDEAGNSRVETGVTLGPAQSIITDAEGAVLKWVEHNGKAAEAGWKDLENIEQKAERLTKAILLHRQPGDIKATTAAIDESKGQANIQAWVGGASRFTKECYEDGATWSNETLPADFEADVFDDFMAMILGGESMESLKWMEERDIIDKETVFQEAQRRRHLQSDLKYDDVRERREREGADIVTDSQE